MNKTGYKRRREATEVLSLSQEEEEENSMVICMASNAWDRKKEEIQEYLLWLEPKTSIFFALFFVF